MKDAKGSEYGHVGTEYALEVGHENDVEGVTFEHSMEDMATPYELLQHMPGARLVRREWAVSDWEPVPADEIDGEEADRG